MAVIEYMMHRIDGGNRRAVPEFVGDRGHWMSPIDNSFIGWVDDSRDYYVPDSVVTLTKEQFVTRQLTIHESHPFMKQVEPGTEPPTEPIPMTVEEVTAQAESWYDSFVAQNS
jgi:hypothetical protein